MVKTKLKRVITAGLVSLLVLAGCGSMGGSDNEPTTAAAVEQATVEEASVEASTEEVTEASEEVTEETTEADKAATTEKTEVTEPEAVAIDKEAFDTLIASGIVADDADIEANEWAKKVKESGELRVGGTRMSFLFSQLDETDNKLRGFDAGLYQLLARYIFGDETKFELTQVDSSTRESVLQTDQVDVVFATYSITPQRAEVISFAGPYYTSRQAILVKKGNTEITGIDSLEGKTVATQAGSTGPDILAEYAPEAEVEEFEDDQAARTALEQGRVDAYVTDYTLLLNSIVKNPEVYEIAGDVFGPEDNYGIGLPLDSDGVQFVNDFLKKIEEDGTWNQLWKISLGDRTGISSVPAAPAIEQ
ncbi:MAG: transporter substrate-binding domain-containing protein [Eubacterium sp.]|nr:transporter substrate-binding domain-containing protein [Eubacterium sp.]